MPCIKTPGQQEAFQVADQRFPKSCRLLDSKSYENVFNKPDFRVSNKYLLILGCWTERENARLGVIVAKKHISRATQRNRIKRLIRESFRITRQQISPADLVVMARKGLDHCENQVCHTYIHDLMEEIGKKNS